MPTLEEVYERRLDGGEGDGRLRVRAGYALLAAGVFLTLLGGVAAFSETVAVLFDATVDWQRWGVGAKFAGVGVPLALTGVFVVVPAPRLDRVVAASGILVAFTGVALFDFAYPHRWSGDALNLTPLVFAVYSLGAFLMFGALFRSVLDVEVALPRSSISFEYDGDELPSREERVSEMTSTSTDGGVGIDVTTNANDAEVVHEGDEDDGPSAGFAGDRYCGNCAFYEYVSRDGGKTFCSFHDTELEDLEACDEHEMRLGTSDE